jgi:diguanylate cyclase (GGDEF)-like protein/PAS domain S-box-containing protein
MENTQKFKYDDNIELASQVFEQSLEGVMITDSNNEIIMVNNAFEQMTGFSRDEVKGLEANILKSGINKKKFYFNMWQKLKESGNYRGEIWNRKKDDTHFACFLSIKVIYDDNGDVKNYIAMYLDITEKLQNEEEIYKLAYHDILTKLPNRTRFNEYLTTLLDHRERVPKQFALLFLDLDNFKYVNDQFGHNIGDLLLIKVAKILKTILRKTDFIARLGGDEFIILVDEYENINQIHVLCDKIIKSLAEKFTIKGNKFKIGCSIGIAIYDNDGKKQTELLKNADTAMHKSKQNGKNRFTFYTQEMNDELKRKIELENGLKNALITGEFEVYYQPKISLKTDKIIGAEALIRWNNAILGVVPPNDFIPFAEEIGLIGEIGDFVLEDVFKNINTIKKYNDDLVVSINISSIQLQEKHFVKKIKKLLNQSDCNTKNIEFEITETIIMTNVDDTIQKLLAIKELGISISIDDFGTGYSSMNYLHKLPIDIIKIDKSFIENIFGKEDSTILINAIVSLSKALNLKTVAEGVEEKFQKEHLKKIDCDIMQGYLFSKPLVFKDFLELITLNN